MRWRKSDRSGAGAPAAAAGQSVTGPAGHEVTLLTRAGCHLCESAEQALRTLRDELGFGYVERDVDGDAALRAEYSDRVPVILVDGKEHGYWRVEEQRLRRALAR